MGKIFRAPSRRTFLVGSGAGVAVAVLGRPDLAFGHTPPTPEPAPSMTTTNGKPTLLSAHCGILGLAMASPAVRADHMQVAAVVTEPCMVKVRAWTASGPSQSFESLWVATTVGTDPTNPVNVAKFWMPTGAGVPGVAWNWQAWTAVAGTSPTAPITAAYGTDGIVRQIPLCPAPGAKQAFSFAASSCTEVAEPNQAERTILSAQSMTKTPITSMTHMGDTSYVDTWTDILQDTDAQTYTKFATGLRRHLTQPDLAKLYNTVPMRMVMDDHESGPDNSYAADVYPQARQVFSDISAGTSFNNSGYDLVHPTAPSYDTWVRGQAQFWLLDNRMWRDTPGSQPQSFDGQKYSSQLGATQRAWLKESLAASTVPVKFIFSPRTVKEFYDGPEAQELLDWITGYLSGEAQVSGKVIFITGDMHAGAVWKLSATHPVYEMLCGPMFNTTLHSPTALKSWQVKWGYQTLFLNTANGQPGRAISNAWGRVDVGVDTSVTLSVVKDDGTVLFQTYIPA